MRQLLNFLDSGNIMYPKLFGSKQRRPMSRDCQPYRDCRYDYKRQFSQPLPPKGPWFSMFLGFLSGGFIIHCLTDKDISKACIKEIYQNQKEKQKTDPECVCDSKPPVRSKSNTSDDQKKNADCFEIVVKKQGMICTQKIKKPPPSKQDTYLGTAVIITKPPPTVKQDTCLGTVVITKPPLSAKQDTCLGTVVITKPPLSAKQDTCLGTVVITKPPTLVNKENLKKDNKNEYEIECDVEGLVNGPDNIELKVQKSPAVINNKTLSPKMEIEKEYDIECDIEGLENGPDVIELKIKK